MKLRWPWGGGEATRRRWTEWARGFSRMPEAPPPPGLEPVAQVLAPQWQEQLRRAAEAETDSLRLQAILDGLDTAVMVLVREGHLAFANQAAIRLWALGQARLGERPAALARIPELPDWLRRGAAGRQTGRLELSDGRVLQLEVAPWAAAGPAGPAVLLAARDISAVVRLETTRRDFIAAVSHELRTPLTSIRGYAEILQDELRPWEPGPRSGESGPAPAWQEPLAIIAANVRRLENLAADLVTLSSMETGQYPFQFRRLNAAELLAPAAAVLRPLAAERGATLTVAGAEPGWIWADPEALHRALLNLGENALLHGATGAASQGLAVELSGRSQEGQYRLQVQDNGAGIGSLDQPHVFERFYRADRSHARTQAKPGGSGLGLALVKHIAQEHGGRVELASRLGAGSTFAICLPLAPNSAEAAVNPHA